MAADDVSPKMMHDGAAIWGRMEVTKFNRRKKVLADR